ncbi:MAG: type 2 isopentenyl-diphosphate Delta-isomerase [Candidatus Micrarchaeota archaeon]
MERQTESRKSDHVRIALNEDVQALTKPGGLDSVDFLHFSLPEMDFADIDASVSFLGRRFSAPFMVSSMTGGYPGAERINRDLAAACAKAGIGLGLGSQRAMLENPSLSKTFCVRDIAPKIFLGANIGAVQLRDYGVKKIESVVSAVEADALFVHLNPLQEAVQPEGDRHWKGCLAAIGKACDSLPVPVIAKETGAGVNAEVARELVDAGVKAIDVSGAGGTSWSAIELYRKGAEAGRVFWDWGVPTAECLRDCSKAVKIPLIASGGIRSGLDAAKAIRLGATLASAALPFIKAQQQGGEKAVVAEIERFRNELKMAMFLTRSKNLAQLRKAALR